MIAVDAYMQQQRQRAALENSTFRVLHQLPAQPERLAAT
jgi:hypothetical protein